MRDVIIIRLKYGEIYHEFKDSAKFQVCAPPTGILFVAGMLKANGVDVAILDAELFNFTANDIKKEIRKEKPRIVGISGTTPEVLTIKKVAKAIKDVDKNIIVVLGGPHSTILPNEAIKDKNIDYLVRGEGEITMLELTQKLMLGQSVKDVKGISYRQKGKIIHNPPRELIKNLDEIPYQARDLLPVEKYTYPAPKLGKVPFVVLLTTRGCPYQCIFCNKMDGSSVRYMSPKRVVDEIAFIHKKYGIKFFQFNDETFNLNHKRVFEICELIIKKKLKIQWYCMVRSNLATKELFQKMKQAGCVRITMGVETGSQEINNILRKGTKLEQYEKAYKWAKEAGIETRGSFIIGNPYDTEKTIKQTIKFAKKLKIDEAYFNIMTPYPATRVYEMAKRGEGLRLLTRDWSKYTRWGDAIIELPTLSRDDLIKWQKRAHRSFYLRPSKVWYQFRRMGLKDSIRAALVYVPALFKK